MFELCRLWKLKGILDEEEENYCNGTYTITVASVFLSSVESQEGETMEGIYKIKHWGKTFGEVRMTLIKIREY